MDDEKLIEKVHSYVELYDPAHPNYQDPKIKDKIWTIIGMELDQPGYVCKTRWNNIRDIYRRSLRKMATKIEECGTGIKKYKYANQLAFLNNYFHPIECVVNVSLDEQQTKQEQESDAFEDTNTPGTNEHSNETIERRYRKTSRNVLQNSRRRYVKRRRTVRSPKYKQEKSTQHSTELTSELVDAFLAGLAPTLKTFTPYYLNLVKSKIFSAVQEYELAMILEKHKRGYSSDVSGRYSPAIPSSPEPETSGIQNMQDFLSAAPLGDSDDGIGTTAR